MGFVLALSCPRGAHDLRPAAAYFPRQPAGRTTRAAVKPAVPAEAPRALGDPGRRLQRDESRQCRFRHGQRLAGLAYRIGTVKNADRRTYDETRVYYPPGGQDIAERWDASVSHEGAAGGDDPLRLGRHRRPDGLASPRSGVGELRLQLRGHLLGAARAAGRSAAGDLERYRLRAVLALVRGAPPPRAARPRSAPGRGRAGAPPRTPHTGRRTSLLSGPRLPRARASASAAPVQAGHDGADRDVEDLRRLLVGEVADVDEHDDVAEVVRHVRRGRRRSVLREPLDDALLVVGAACASSSRL